VGDSRLYLVRGGQIYLMTEDHSAVMEMVKQGLLTLEQARHHPEKNVILRALGSHAEVEITIWEELFPVHEGDRFLLCSDGLYDLVEDNEILQAVVAGSAQSACEALIALAKERGGYDNITVGIVGLNPAAEGKPAGVPETRELKAGQST
jgi:serine/threonine protein phosphatase PrpC